MTVRRTKGRWLAFSIAGLATAGVAATSATGCEGGRAEEGCAQLRACGGDPTGFWKATSWCQAAPPSTNTTNTGLFPYQTAVQTPQGPARPPPNLSGDWCSELVYLPFVANNPMIPSTDGLVSAVNLFRAPPPVTDVSLDLKPDHSYQATLQVVGPTTTHFDSSCLKAHGANPTCDALERQLVEYYRSAVSIQMGSMQCCAPDSPGTYPRSDKDCARASSNGCDCTYKYESTTADFGIWRVDGNFLYQFSSLSLLQPITTTTFCVDHGSNPPTLTVSGYNGESIFGLNGFRSATMLPMTGM